MKEDEKQVPFLLTKRIRFHDAPPPLASIADVYVEELLHLPSPHMTSREMLQLRKRIEETTANEQWKDSVVTHGTDTLEETAYFFKFKRVNGHTIVITGAMEIGADGA